MNFKKQIILFSILAMSVMAVSAEDISTYNPQVIENHQITNADIASATSYGQSLVEKKNIKMISTAKKKFIKRRYGGIFPRIIQHEMLIIYYGSDLSIICRKVRFIMILIMSLYL